MSNDNLKEWIVMIYFAADNDLTGAAVNNLLQLGEVGSTDQVQIFAQIDKFNATDLPVRYVARVGRGLIPTNLTVEPNTGSVDDFLKFVDWVVEQGHKAKKILIVLWGHGDGVDDNDEDEVEAVETVLVPSGVPDKTVSENSHLLAALESSALTTTAANIESFGEDAHASSVIPSLLLDEHPRDSLTNRELKEAIAKASKKLGVDKIDILGMDACLMSMLEVAQQVCDSAELMVASEHTVPDKSWPYDKVLKRLVAKPKSTPRQLARIIVNEYLKFYKRTDEAVMLAACDLTKTAGLSEKVRTLGETLTKSLHKKRLRQAIVRARRYTQSFMISDYIDLYHFCQTLQATLADDPFKTACQADPEGCARLKEDCQGVMDAIQSTDKKANFVVYSKIGSGEESQTLTNAHGVSIYFPLILPLYRNLELCKTAHWDSFLSDYMSCIFRPPTAPTNSETTAPGQTTTGTPISATVWRNTAMSTTKIRTIVLPIGAIVTNPTDGSVLELTGMSSLNMTKNPLVVLKMGTDLRLPNGGHKAVTGTPVKGPQGTSVGAPKDTPPPEVTMLVPACTLVETDKGNKETDLPDNTKIKTKPGGSPVTVLASLRFKGQTM